MGVLRNCTAGIFYPFTLCLFSTIFQISNSTPPALNHNSKFYLLCTPCIMMSAALSCALAACLVPVRFYLCALPTTLLALHACRCGIRYSQCSLSLFFRHHIYSIYSDALALKRAAQVAGIKKFRRTLYMREKCNVLKMNVLRKR